VTPEEIASLLAPLTALQKLLARFDDRGIVIGGVAASLLGKPRLTADVDAVILLSVDDLPRLIQAARDEGLVPRISDAEKFAGRNRVLLLRHEASDINIDISLGILPFEIEAVERSIVYQAGPLSIRLPTPEDLIIFKAVAHRPKDLLDIQAIIASHPDLDRARVRYWVGEFAKVLEMPELWDDIAAWL
jgi:Nucleotidyltransferase of unknown function (DUF6036)